MEGNLTWIAALAALGGAAIGATVSIVQMSLHHVRETRIHNEHLLTQALTMVGQRENERSAGIAIIEGKFRHTTRYRSILLPALVGQAVYLLLHTDNEESRSEFYNWLRIMEILEDWMSEPTEPVGHYLGEIQNAFLIKASHDHTAGIKMSWGTLEVWAKTFGLHDLKELSEIPEPEL